MAPKHVEFVEELPVTDTGKVKKTALGATSKGETVGEDRVEGAPVPARKLLRGR
jgi:acyl-coenzyme A synthetase/AMP-(fatty) acid ligase